jgi:DNA invertase Pin-like site-specific DNA recombinase
MRRGALIYLRVSTKPQAHGDGLVRQLQECIRYADKRRIRIFGVFGDVGSGDGVMPNRTLCYEEAVRMDRWILVESSDRWSRKAAGDDHLPDDRVVVTSPTAIEFEQKIGRIVGQYMREMIRGKNIGGMTHGTPK